jgi:hypothetical protein
MELSFLTRALISSLQRSKKPVGTSGGERISISRTVSAIAVLYEKVRVAIEFREEHLLRRAAIERILKRRLILNENGRNIAEYLLKEILWAKYAPEDSIPMHMVDEVQASVDKYIYLRNEIAKGKPIETKAKFHEWLISIAAAEIEQKLAKDSIREAFINFIFKYFEPKVFLQNENEETTNVETYIAVHKSFAKSDADFIRYELLKLSIPDIIRKRWKDTTPHIKEIEDMLTGIDRYLHHRILDKLTRSLKKEMAAFLVLRDLYEQERDNFSTVLSDEKLFVSKVNTICTKRYEEIRKKLTRAGWRSIIYIFLTKVLFAFLLEYPFERYVLNDFRVESLAINMIFPPLLMFFALIGVKPPGPDNTKRIINRLIEIVTTDGMKDQQITIAFKTPGRRPIMTFVFTTVYLLTFFLVFGGIIALLTLLNFSIASQAVFIFFVSLVIFFAYRVRQTGKDYTIAEKESYTAPIMTFFLLPILNVGKWLSGEIARFNFLVALFDFVIEAPFKAIFEIFEEWFTFLRKKREEII